MSVKKIEDKFTFAQGLIQHKLYDKPLQFLPHLRMVNHVIYVANCCGDKKVEEKIIYHLEERDSFNFVMNTDYKINYTNKQIIR